MGREIKFRAWDKEEGRFLHCSEFEKRICWNHQRGDATLIVIDEFNGRYAKDLGFSIELQQFTSLLDKNGKEIYEGDICKYSHGKDFETGIDHEQVSPVIMDLEKGTGHYLRYFLEGAYLNLNTRSVEAYRIEVIGNIYENPELLGNS